MTRNFLLDLKIPEVGAEEIDAHFHLLPDSYFLKTSSEEIKLHIRMINKLLFEINHADSVGSLRPIIEWSRGIEKGLTLVNVVTWDRAGLFHKLAGALNVAGYNIQSAQAISRSDNIAIDTFYVESRGSGDLNRRENVFEECLSQALVSNENLYPRIRDAFHAQPDRSLKPSYNRVAHTFHPKAEIYQALSRKSAIIETHSPDTPGFLYRLTRRLHNSGFDIISASIDTKQGIAIDTLKFKSTVPNQTIKREALVELNARITQTLNSDNSIADTTN